MSIRILLVRAVNVGGVKLPMAEFRRLLAQIGGANVRTYIASGNAVVDVAGDFRAFDRAVEKAVADEYGYSREVISRTPAEVEAALDAHPFAVIEPKYSYIVFLNAAPGAAELAAARGVPSGEDLWEVIGSDLHLRYAEGAGRPGVNVDALFRRLKVVGTARNLRTVRALVDLARS